MATQDIKGKNLVYDTRSAILEMLESRGYNIDDYKSFTKDEIILQFKQSNSKFLQSGERSPLDILVKNDKDQKIYVKYRLDFKFKKSKSLDQQIDTIYNDIINKDDTLIVIYVSRILSIHKDSNVYQYSENIFNKKQFFVQFFGLENFLFNPTKNNIVPKHTIVEQNDQEAVLQRYNISDKSKLLIIVREDPIAKYIGLKPGQICKIEGKSYSSMNTVKHRLCVNSQN